MYSQYRVIQTSRSRICGIKEREREREREREIQQERKRVRERTIQQEKEKREGKGVNESGREKVSLFDILFIGCRSTTGNPVLWKATKLHQVVFTAVSGERNANRLGDCLDLLL